MPRVSRTCDRNMVPNLPAPIRPTASGRSSASRASNLAWRFTPEMLLAHCPADKGDVLALARLRLALAGGHPHRALLCGGDIDAGAEGETFGLAKLVGGVLAVGRAIGGDRAGLVTGDDPGGRQLDDRIGGVLDRAPGRLG